MMELAHLIVERQDTLNERLNVIEKVAGLDTKQLQQQDQELSDGINHLVNQLKKKKSVEGNSNG
jgi:hypothetical protein